MTAFDFVKLHRPHYEPAKVNGREMLAEQEPFEPYRVHIACSCGVEWVGRRIDHEGAVKVLPL